MENIGVELRTAGPRVGDRPPGDGRGVGWGRVLATELVTYPTLLLVAIVVYTALVAPPLLALLPVVVTDLVVRAVGALFGAIS